MGRGRWGVPVPGGRCAARDVGRARAGRGLDGAPASLRVLPAVRAAVGATFPLLFDGGIRSGADAFKAIAYRHLAPDAR